MTNTPLRIFIGYDERQAVTYNVLQHSINATAKRPVSITALRISQLPIRRRGLTPFTFSRFLVPYLCDYKGVGLFLDADMLLRDDIGALFDLFDGKSAVQVSKNPHRFEWASVMLFNCEHPANAVLTPEYIETADGLHTINWCKEEEIGEIPGDWNFLSGYDDMNPDASLVHYTQGIPAFPETIVCDYSGIWHENHKAMNASIPWVNLMGPSVHAVTVNGKLLPKFLFDLEKNAPKPQYVEHVKRLLSEASGGDVRRNEESHS